MAIHNSIQYPVHQIRDWISEGRTQQSIADELSVTLDPRITCKLIGKVCKKHGIKCQRTGPRSGPGHPEWTGGRILAKNGYWMIYAPDHPTCVEKTARRMSKSDGGYVRKHRYVWEHRLVMERKIGRHLLPNEVVHHIDGDKGNNHPDNLELFQNNGEHLRTTLAGMVPKWTDDGLRSMLNHRCADHRQSVKTLKASILAELGEYDFRNNAVLRRCLKRLGTTAIELCETASQLGRLPDDFRSMLERERVR